MNKSTAAEGKLKIGIQRFLSKYPFLGGHLAVWRIQVDDSIGTMGIGIEGAGFILVYNSKFVNRLRMDTLIGVLHHEVRHVIYGHLFMTREQYPDNRALIIAQEVSVNENIPEPLPRRCIRLKDYPRLKANQDTDTRYRLLAKRRRSEPPQAASTGVHNGQRSGRAQKPVQTLDDHSRWQQVRDAGTFARGLIDARTQEVLRELPALSAYEKTIIEHMAKQQGFNPGDLYSDLATSHSAQRFNWQNVLRRYVGEFTEKAPSLMRPPRRFPHLVGIVPGAASQSARPKVMVSIDTSGSMSDHILAEISRELTFLARNREIWIVECDAEIHQVYRYHHVIDRISGRGGTDFTPPLRPSFLCKYRPDVVIFFTDGYGEAPASPPQVPVIWVLTPEGERPVPWGHMIKIDEKSGPEA